MPRSPKCGCNCFSNVSTKQWKTVKIRGEYFEMLKLCDFSTHRSLGKSVVEPISKSTETGKGIFLKVKEFLINYGFTELNHLIFLFFYNKWSNLPIGGNTNLVRFLFRNKWFTIASPSIPVLNLFFLRYRVWPSLNIWGFSKTGSRIN